MEMDFFGGLWQPVLIKGVDENVVLANFGKGAIGAGIAYWHRVCLQCNWWWAGDQFLTVVLDRKVGRWLPIRFAPLAIVTYLGPDSADAAVTAPAGCRTSLQTI